MPRKKQTSDIAEEIKDTLEGAANNVVEATKSVRKRVTHSTDVYVEFAGSKINVDAVVEAAKADFKMNNKGTVKTAELYIKPEDGMAYYVINGVEGKVAL